MKGAKGGPGGEGGGKGGGAGGLQGTSGDRRGVRLVTRRRAATLGRQLSVKSMPGGRAGT